MVHLRQRCVARHRHRAVKPTTNFPKQPDPRSRYLAAPLHPRPPCSRRTSNPPKAQGEKGFAIREELKMPQDLQMTRLLQLPWISMGRQDEARIWLGNSQEILEGRDDELHVRLLCQNNLNFSRNLSLLHGRLSPAPRRNFDRAIAQAKAFGTLWFS